MAASPIVTTLGRLTTPPFNASTRKPPPELPAAGATTLGKLGSDNVLPTPEARNMLPPLVPAAKLMTPGSEMSPPLLAKRFPPLIRVMPVASKFAWGPLEVSDAPEVIVNAPVNCDRSVTVRLPLRTMLVALNSAFTDCVPVTVTLELMPAGIETVSPAVGTTSVLQLSALVQLTPSPPPSHTRVGVNSIWALTANANCRVTPVREGGRNWESGGVVFAFVEICALFLATKLPGLRFLTVVEFFLFVSFSCFFLTMSCVFVVGLTLTVYPYDSFDALARSTSVLHTLAPPAIPADDP